MTIYREQTNSNISAFSRYGMETNINISDHLIEQTLSLKAVKIQIF